MKSPQWNNTHTETFLIGFTLETEEWDRIPQEGKDIFYITFLFLLRIEHNVKYKLESYYLFMRGWLQQSIKIGYIYSYITNGPTLVFTKCEQRLGNELAFLFLWNSYKFYLLLFMVTEQKELWPINTTDFMYFWKPTMFLSITDMFLLWEVVGSTCHSSPNCFHLYHDNEHHTHQEMWQFL